MRIVKIKKITLTFGIVSVMMASLFGCGKKNEEKADNTNSATTVETGDSGEASDTSLCIYIVLPAINLFIKGLE